jgi:hypothetical protein
VLICCEELAAAAMILSMSTHQKAKLLLPRLATVASYFLSKKANNHQSFKRKLYSIDTYRASQTIYLKRLQGMVIHSRHGDRDGYTFNKFSALRPSY